MKANLNPLPKVSDLKNPFTEAVSPGIIGPSKDGWGKTVRCWGGYAPNFVIYESENVEECPFCHTDLSKFSKPKNEKKRMQSSKKEFIGDFEVAAHVHDAPMCIELTLKGKLLESLEYEDAEAFNADYRLIVRILKYALKSE